jgi:hypothetical protein
MTRRDLQHCTDVAARLNGRLKRCFKYCAVGPSPNAPDPHFLENGWAQENDQAKAQQDEAATDLDQYLANSVDGSAKPDQHGGGRRDLRRGSVDPLGRQAFLKPRLAYAMLWSYRRRLRFGYDSEKNSPPKLNAQRLDTKANNYDSIDILSHSIASIGRLQTLPRLSLIFEPSRLPNAN